LPGIIHKANAAIGPLLARRDEWLKQTGLGVNELNRS
jgi:hypothetical protein